MTRKTRLDGPETPAPLKGPAGSQAGGQPQWSVLGSGDIVPVCSLSSCEPTPNVIGLSGF